MPSDDQKYNSDLANRQIEINEWSYNNKMDTLFVFQVLFMSLLFISIVMMLNKSGIVGSAFVGYTLCIVVFLIIIIIVNRSMYTNTRRDTKLWNRRRFDGDNSTTSPLMLGDRSYQDYLDAVKAQYGTTSESTGCPKCP